MPSEPHINATNVEVSLLDLGVVVAENIRLLVFGPLLAGLIALGTCFLIPPSYTARTSFLPPQQQQSAAMAALSQLGVLSGISASAAGLKNPTDQYVALIKSTVVGDRLVDRFKLMELYDVHYREDARKTLEKKTVVSSGKDGLIVVEVDDHSPRRAAEIAGAYVIELRSLLSNLALTEAQNRRVFFEKQLEQTKSRLTEAEMALGATGVSASAIRADPKASVEVVARIQAQVTMQEVRLSSMRGYLSDSAPEVRQAQTELTALRAQLKKSGVSDPNASSAGGYIEKYRDFKYQETLFELFARQFELAKVDEAREGAVIQVVDDALPPERKSKPKKGLIAVLAASATALLLLIWVFIYRTFANSIHSPADATKVATMRAGFRRLFLLRN
jgi:uncharacterized protein involved in exopolysaccharide biosynthesis